MRHSQPPSVHTQGIRQAAVPSRPRRCGVHGCGWRTGDRRRRRRGCGCESNGGWELGRWERRRSCRRATRDVRVCVWERERERGEGDVRCPRGAWVVRTCRAGYSRVGRRPACLLRPDRCKGAGAGASPLPKPRARPKPTDGVFCHHWRPGAAGIRSYPSLKAADAVLRVSELSNRASTLCTPLLFLRRLP